MFNTWGEDNIYMHKLLCTVPSNITVYTSFQSHRFRKITISKKGYVIQFFPVVANYDL